MVLSPTGRKRMRFFPAASIPPPFLWRGIKRDRFPSPIEAPQRPSRLRDRQPFHPSVYGGVLRVVFGGILVSVRGWFHPLGRPCRPLTTRWAPLTIRKTGRPSS